MKTMLIRGLLAVAVLAMLLGAQVTSEASIVSVSNGTLSADAEFTLSGTTLTITLTNTGTSTVNSTLIHGLFFNVSGSETLVAGTANLGPGSTHVEIGGNTGSPPYNAANGWGFYSGAPVSREYAIISAGYNIGGGSNFTNSNGQALDGTNWGIINSAGPGSTLDASGGQQPRVVVDNAMVFTLTGFSGSLKDINGVQIQWGTSLNDPNSDDPDFGDDVVPEPMSLAIWGSISVLGCAFGAYRRRKQVA